MDEGIDERRTRYLQSYCPGSTFKPITGAIGLTTGSLSEQDTFTYSGTRWKKDDWVEGAFSAEAANVIKDDLIQVVEIGTAKDMKVAGRTIAGKTGTAELKASKDAKADILGWFNCFTTDDSGEQLLIVSMVENGRDLGGSHYLIKKIKPLF